MPTPILNQLTLFSLIRTIDAASTVLLKNVDGTLPLSKPKTIGIIGNGAGSNPQGPNGYVSHKHPDCKLNRLRLFIQSFTDRGGDSGVLGIGWGSGTADFPYLIAVGLLFFFPPSSAPLIVRIQPVDAITTRAKQDGTTVTSSLSDTDLSGAANAAAGKDIALVFITADSGCVLITQSTRSILKR